MKRFCRECKWHGPESEVLEALNPFEDDNVIMLGCPQCREANQIGMCCDAPECWNEATCGTNTPNGYRRLCGEHYRKLNADVLTHARP